jgi:hypothetical protein
MLGTFTLVITTTFGGFTLPPTHTPGLTGLACALQAAKVAWPRTGTCEREGGDPLLPPPQPKCYTICGWGTPPCWEACGH